MFIQARRRGGPDRSDVKIITCGVSVLHYHVTADWIQEHLQLLPPCEYVNKLDPSTKGKIIKVILHIKKVKNDKVWSTIGVPGHIPGQRFENETWTESVGSFYKLEGVSWEEGAKGNIRSKGNFLY